MSTALPINTMRADFVAAESTETTTQVDRLLRIAVSGLRAMYRGADQDFPYTARGVPSPQGPRLQLEGSSLRYTAMAALGLSRTSQDVQRSVMGGGTAAELAALVGKRALLQDDLGAVALAAWASAEAGGHGEDGLLATIERRMRSSSALDTVSASWALTAAVAASDLSDTSALRSLAAERLLDSQGANGIFPHALPASSLGRLRSHVGCFADQVYPVQALSRLSALTGDMTALAAADACAQRICDLQGVSGQWWWHYDARTGDVVERFPVYSVHQHAMAPMALFELRESGGRDHVHSVIKGLQWLDLHPEVLAPLIDDRLDVVWRKVGRREPAKASRRVAAVLTAARPGASLPGVDRLLPAVVVDHECRPYELGWLLYTWLAPGPARDGITGPLSL